MNISLANISSRRNRRSQFYFVFILTIFRFASTFDFKMTGHAGGLRTVSTMVQWKLSETNRLFIFHSHDFWSSVSFATLCFDDGKCLAGRKIF